MNKTTRFSYISNGKVQTGVMAGHLSESQIQLALLARGIGCRKVVKTSYDHRNLVRIRF